MYNQESSPTLNNCTFTDNTAEYGGGMINEDSETTLNNCTFTGNGAAEAGGGVSTVEDGSVVILEGTTICGNNVDGEATDENQIEGAYTETGVNCISAECIYVDDDVTPFCFGSCPADLNADGFVDGKDLGILLGAWSNDVPIADFNQDGIVDGLDLTVLMAEWGTCLE